MLESFAAKKPIAIRARAPMGCRMRPRLPKDEDMASRKRRQGPLVLRSTRGAPPWIAAMRSLRQSSRSMGRGSI